MNSISDLDNIHRISIAFDGLATGENFILSNLIALIKGNNNTVTMIHYNHTAKNIRSQLVLGSSIVTGVMLLLMSPSLD